MSDNETTYGRRALLAKLGGAAAAGVGAAAVGAALAPGVAGASAAQVVDGGTTEDGLEAKTSSAGHSAVYAHHDGSGTGFGVYAISNGGPTLAAPSSGALIGLSANSNGVWGGSDALYGVYGQSGARASGNPPDPAGVVGSSKNQPGVIGVSDVGPGVQGTSGGSGVYGLGTGQGETVGVYGSAPHGVGVYGTSTQFSGVIGQSTADVGVSGYSHDVAGVEGFSATGVGVHGWNGDTSTGVAAGRAGVFGEALSSAGVLGASVSGHGVAGTTASGSAGGGAGVSAANTSSGPALIASAISGEGVHAISTSGVGVFASGGRAALAIAPRAGIGAPAGDHSQGEIVIDNTGAMFVCTGSGNPGTWQQVAYGGGGGGGGFVAVSPNRIVDTRPGNPPDNPGEHRLSAGEEILVPIAGHIPVSVGATAVVLNVTAVSPSGAGYLSLYPADQSYSAGNPPNFSNVNYGGPVGAVANSATVRLAATGANVGALKVFAGVSAVDVILDVAGYYM